MKRHWAINGRFLAQPMTGVQRYAREIVRALDLLLAEKPPLARDLEIELLVPPEAASAIELTSIGARAVGRHGGHLWEQFSLPAHVRGGLLSLCNTGPLALRKHIVCIHDATTRTYPQSYSFAFRALYRILLPLLGRTAAAVSTVSHYSAGELVRFGISPADKVFVAPNGHEHATRWKPRHSPATRGVTARDTIVVIGSPVPHKNSGLIIGMADRLAGAGLRVAVVGMSDPRVFKSSFQFAPADNVAWLGRLSDEEMAALLRSSLCLAFPSFVEGFGLPPLEAMTAGCPVVVSDRASLPEICGDAALYASPDDAEAWYGCFLRLAGTPALREELIRRGQERISAFRWKASAERYLQAMAAADGLREDPISANDHSSSAPSTKPARSATLALGRMKTS
jgi:glycosyltransferase involved in cell wall biosynthesis